MRSLTTATTSTTTAKTAALLLGFRFHPEFLIQGIGHTESHRSHNEALGCLAHVDQVDRHFSAPLALQFIQPVRDDCCQTLHSNRDKRCLFSFSDKFRSLTLIIWRKRNVCVGWHTVWRVFQHQHLSNTNPLLVLSLCTLQGMIFVFVPSCLNYHSSPIFLALLSI